MKTHHSTARAPLDTDRMAGERVRQFRLERNMTLAELGAELGISHQQLQKYETAANRMSVGMLVRIAAALHRPVLDFFEQPEAVTPPPARLHLQEARGLIEAALRTL